MPAALSHYSAVCGRYARAAVSVAKDTAGLDALERDVRTVQTLINDNPAVHRVLCLPIYQSVDQMAVLEQIAARLSLSLAMKNTLLLMALKRRLAFVSEFLHAVSCLINREKNQLTAYVRSAHPLDRAQSDALRRQLEQATGCTICLDTVVDRSLIGGLCVDIGSERMDNSIKMNLDRLYDTIKG